jgi:murein DD-endopeptidase MepM/ murein hydrolase activator NlpD
VQLRLASARADAGFAAVRQAVAGESLDDVSAALTAEEDQLRRQAVEAYMGGGEIALATTAVVVGLESYSDVETAREYAEAIINSQLTTIDQVDALRLAVVGLGEIVASIEVEADAERVSVIKEHADALIVQQRALVGEAELETEAIAQRIAAIQERKQAYAEELRITGAGGGAIGEMLRNRQLDQEPPTDPFGLLGMPLGSTRLGSPFGPRVHPIFSDTRLHTGIDMSGQSGDPMVASADGVVVYAAEASGYGNVVVVDHGNTIATLYAHMTADAVWAGLEVVEGDLLGFVGSTGFSTGPHLHYEVRVAGQPVNPTPYLDFS